MDVNKWDTTFQILPKHLQDSVKRLIDKEGYITFNVETTKIPADGGNYLSSLYRINIKGQDSDGDKQTSIFIKKSLELCENTMSLVEIEDACAHELLFYNTIAKLFDSLQRDARVPEKERFCSAKMYDESTEYAMIFENLTVKGYDNFSRFQVLPLEYLEMSLKILAKFHALSYALESKYPEYVRTTVKSLKPVIQFSKRFLDVCYINKDISKTTVTKEIGKRIDDMFPELTSHVHSLICDVTKTKRPCLCYGDFRPNNIMKKEINGRITSVLPIDFQCIFYGAPVLDFIYFITLSLDQEQKKQHLPYLKDVYHNHFTEFLKYFDMDINQVYSRDFFDEEYSRCSRYGLLLGIAYLPFILHPEKDAPELETLDFNNIPRNTNEFCLQKMKGIINEYIDLGTL